MINIKLVFGSYTSSLLFKRQSGQSVYQYLLFNCPQCLMKICCVYVLLSDCANIQNLFLSSIGWGTWAIKTAITKRGVKAFVLCGCLTFVFTLDLRAQTLSSFCLKNNAQLIFILCQRAAVSSDCAFMLCAFMWSKIVHD